MTSADTELDVRTLRKPDKHPTIFATYAALAIGDSFVLINDHDPVHLHDQFESGHSGAYGWEYLSTEVRNWRIRITKISETVAPEPVPDQAGDTRSLIDLTDVSDA